LERKSIQKVLSEKDFFQLQQVGVFKENLSYSDYYVTDEMGNQYSTDLRETENIAALQENCIGDTLKNGFIMVGAFFLGSKTFYDALLNMDEEQRKSIHMNSALHVNHLYGDEKLRRAQRKNARFINTGMYLTLLGGIASDQLEDGRMISGVGGQYNFVEQGLALEDGHAIMLFKSTKGSGKRLKSNIRFSYGHITIPRFLKDIMVTEYGIADIRVATDEETIKAILNITDSRFQDKLMLQAKKAGKLDENYQIPPEFRNNFPETLKKQFNKYQAQGYFENFPFGSDYTKEEIVLGAALRTLKNFAANHKLQMIPVLLKSVPKAKLEKAKPYLERMALDSPKDKHEVINQKLVVFALELMKAI
jgi:hypothetical protein